MACKDSRTRAPVAPKFFGTIVTDFAAAEILRLRQTTRPIAASLTTKETRSGFV
jgi:hypothetical protein